MSSSLAAYFNQVDPSRLEGDWTKDDELFAEAMGFCLQRERNALAAMRPATLLNEPEPTQLDRIEAKLDQLIDALAADYDDGDEDVLRSLDDGSAVGQARDTDQPL